MPGSIRECSVSQLTMRDRAMPLVIVRLGAAVAAHHRQAGLAPLQRLQFAQCDRLTERRAERPDRPDLPDLATSSLRPDHFRVCLDACGLWCGVADVLRRCLPCRRHIVDSLASLLRVLHELHEVRDEFRLRLHVGHRRGGRVVTVDDHVDVLQFGSGVRQRRRVLHAAAAVVLVHDRQVARVERVPGVHGPERGEDDEGIAAGVGVAVVIEVDLIGALADRHLVLEGLGRQALAVVPLEDVRTRGRRGKTSDRPHVLHADLGGFLHDDLDVRGELDVAAHVIAVGVGVDDARDGLTGHRLDLVEQRLPPAGVLGVHHRHAGGHDEHGAVAAAALHHVQVVLEFLDFDHHGSRRRLLIRSRRHRQDTGR